MVRGPAYRANAPPDGALPSHQSQRSLPMMNVIKREGTIVPFDRTRIEVAVTKAFLDVENRKGEEPGRRIKEIASAITDDVMAALDRHPDRTPHIEDIQDQVELALMRAGEHKVARAYVLYRERRAAERPKPQDLLDPGLAIHIKDANGKVMPLDGEMLIRRINLACENLAGVEPSRVRELTVKGCYEGMSISDLDQTLVMSARSLIERDPNYAFVAGRLLLDNLYTETTSRLIEPGKRPSRLEMASLYRIGFMQYIREGVRLELIDPVLADYNVSALADAIQPERDLKLDYLGLQTLADRYLIHHDGVRIELPQMLFMRVAMGLAINEVDRETKAVEFYELLSSLDFMSSTPTLFNAGTLRPQLSSCYLTTVPDDLDGIFAAVKDNALLSKFAGGLGNDWTRVRGLGAHIKGTNGKSQGVVPFLKVANDTAVAVNQGGKRKGAVCAYLETWHVDVEEFLELRKNTGDERRRTHDMNTANWIPDLFMKRVAEEGEWTLFSPNETPDLHDLVGTAFEARYAEYEAKAARGELKVFRKLKAVDLWRKMLSMLFETGHPWVAFKDPCNLRSPQQHVGVVHSSNLCTEITLNTSDDEIAVCNLGSVNLAQHVTEQGLDTAKLARTIKTAMRMLDNVIDYNYYSVPQAHRANLRHRPVGLGLMGFQDALYKLRLPYASEAAVEFADRSMEAVSYYAIKASAELARERGAYESFAGSLWSKGILPIDSVGYVSKARGGYCDMDDSATLDWDRIRELVKGGMRNSNTMAIAPTATISNICGVSQSIEPIYQNLYVKSNLSGEFTVVNRYLVADLKQRDLWDEVMVNDLKYYDGSVNAIDRVPDDLKALYATAFEVDPRWLVEAASRRQKWIDQAQSLNLYMAEPSGKKLDNLYKLAWVRGLKTTYYLRSQAATQVEKSNTRVEALPEKADEPKVCSILDPDCEACQ
ncbi:ribonucleoside-diphosphate reductase subunit alpha [Acidihalobacter yilgarnensis]|uniref:Ribonucleoside-diphosphate reductase n=1 Tax=Acidihalobacter yilgarnensis TaxID=2819280 RepID=A0A1D8ISW7_9GAMM|nr:ribonucleoside-diphosphate reductase subunit alpha [Acidihalobacter yilgarnensis]